MKFLCFKALVLALGVAVCAATSAVAQPLTPEDVFKQPQFRSPAFSRDGKFLGALAPVGEKMNLVVLEMATNKVQAITSFADFDVVSFNWIGSNRLVFGLGNINSPTGPDRGDGGGLFAVDRDGKNGQELSPTIKAVRAQNQYVYRGYSYERSVPGSEDEIIASSTRRDQTSADLYRLNTRTKRATLITVDRPQRTNDWELDSKLVPRVTSTWIKDTNEFIIHYRSTETSPWKEILRYNRAKAPMYQVLAFDSNDKTLQVATNEFGPTMAIYRFDPESGKWGEKLAEHPRFDMGAAANGSGVPGVIIEPETNLVRGYRVDADRLETTWIDPEYARLQASIDGALPGRVNRFTRLPGDKNRMLITSYSDVAPSEWLIYDDSKKTLTQLLVSRPWLSGRLTEQIPFLLKTRDGLEIPSYYFLPKGHKPGAKLPTIVHIHGGPFARADRWGSGFGYLEAQLFASHGYAVIVPNFRVTPGLGSKNYYAGFGTVGRQMSEDHEDAAKWGISQGFVDPSKICMSGASYGGFATLHALIKTPELFKCGVAGLVVSDYKLQLTSPAGDSAGSPAGVEYWKSVLGVKDLGEQVVADVSPALNAQKLKSPVFIYAGLEDIRTPIEQTNAMIRGLERSGNPPKDVFIAKEEGHGFGKLANNVELYTRVLKFLDEQIGSKSK